MTTVSIKQTFQNGGCFMIEASELGLAPGVWPTVIHTTDIGNLKPFYGPKMRSDRPDSIFYKQDGGLAWLEVIND